MPIIAATKGLRAPSHSFRGSKVEVLDGDQKVTKFGRYKKEDFAGCLKISNLQSLLVPASDIFSNSFLEDLDKLWLLWEWIPGPKSAEIHYPSRFPKILRLNGVIFH